MKLKRTPEAIAARMLPPVTARASLGNERFHALLSPSHPTWTPEEAAFVAQHIDACAAVENARG